jgi:glucose-6-phosphate isomerase
MAMMYLDSVAVAKQLSVSDPVFFVFYASVLPVEDGQVLYCTTFLYPCNIGDEYYLTKGHFHAQRNQGEVYFGLAGTGYLLLQTDSGEVRDVPMEKGTVAYVPPYWAHRTINVGTVPFIFFAAWPGDAGHDYGTIEAMGFPKLCVEQNHKPVFIDNPNFRGG